MEKLTRVKFSNLDKVLYPDLKLTKIDIIKYYIKVAPRMLPFLMSRALVVARYPDGIGEAGFYEKDVPKGKPEWVKTFTKYSKSVDRYTSYIVCDDLDTLIWLANLAALEIHIPLSKVPDTANPDLILFDLDPEPPAGLDEAVQAALLVKEKLDELGVVSFLKTSGGKGLHVVASIEPIYSFDQTRRFVHGIGIMLAQESEIIVSERRQTKEQGKVLIDYPQNTERATMIAPYSLRAVREATISTPLEWSELADIRHFYHNIFNVPNRVYDPWSRLFDSPQRLPKIN
jgi:bifunctional non-homologous end joining protein LigD